MSGDADFYEYEDEEEDEDLYEDEEAEDEEIEHDLQLFELVDKSPEEAMKLARESIVEGWYQEWFELEEDNTSWTSAKWLINTLMEKAKRGLDSEDLLGRLEWFAEPFYFSSGHLEYLWSKLTPEQKEAFLKGLYHDLAKVGLIDFLKSAGRKLSIKEINDYLYGKISFRDLMDKLAKKYNVYKYKPEIAEDFWNAVDLAAYLSDEELKKIVKDYVLDAKLEELEERKQKQELEKRKQKRR